MCANRARFFAFVVCFVIGVSHLWADDWPSFRGPRQDGVSPDRAIARNWPKDGLRILWTQEVGPAFSSFAVVGDRLYTCGAEDDQQTVFCLKLDTGEVVWKKSLERQITDPDEHLHGTRTTPTVDDGRCYVIGGHGAFCCFDAKTGEELWKRTLLEQPHWGYAGSVLIEGRLAIVTAGGEDGSLLAVDKKTGKTVWKCGKDPVAYAMPLAFDIGGRRCICGFLAEHVIVADAKNGELLLRLPRSSHAGVNASMPIFHDGHLLVSSGYGHGSCLYKLEPDGDKLKATEVWRSGKLGNKFQTGVLHQGRLYSSDEHGLKCLDFMAGKLLWRQRGVRHGTLVRAGDDLLLFTEKGELQLAPASNEGFNPIAQAKLFEGSGYSLFQKMARQRQGARCWTVPVLLDGKLYIRSHTTVACVDLREASEVAAAE